MILLFNQPGVKEGSLTYTGPLQYWREICMMFSGSTSTRQAQNGIMLRSSSKHMAPERCFRRSSGSRGLSSQVARRQTCMKAQGKFFIGGNWKCNGGYLQLTNEYRRENQSHNHKDNGKPGNTAWLDYIHLRSDKLSFILRQT